MVSWRYALDANELHTIAGRLLEEAGRRWLAPKIAEAVEVLVLDLCILESHKGQVEVEERRQQ
jgi:hypothetical protein